MPRLIKRMCLLPAGLGSILFLASPVTPGTMADVSTLEWKGMLVRARAGGVINLGQRRVTFARQVFQPTAPVTIRGGVFEPIVLDQWRNVTFDGSNFVGAPGTKSFASLVSAYQVENLTLRNCRFTGYQTGNGELHVRGVAVTGGRNVSIERSTFVRLAGFIQYARTDGARFVDNDLRAIREGVNFIGARNVTVERNLFEDFRPFGQDHADAIQFFTAGLTRPGDSAGRDVVIRHNLIVADGRAQGIFSRDELNLASSGRGYQRFLVEENTILGAAWHGITAGKIDGVTIRNNRLLRTGGDKMENRISVMGGNGTVAGNQANAFILNGAVGHNGNATVRQSEPAQVQSLIAAWKARFRKS